MMTMEALKEALRDRRLTVVADQTGLHYNTVRAYAKGDVKRPSVDVVTRLSEYLSK